MRRKDRREKGCAEVALFLLLCTNLPHPCTYSRVIIFQLVYVDSSFHSPLPKGDSGPVPCRIDRAVTANTAI